MNNQEQTEEVAGCVGPPLLLTGVQMPDDPIIAGRRLTPTLPNKWNLFEPKPKPKPIKEFVEQREKIHYSIKDDSLNPIGDWIAKHNSSFWWGMLTVIVVLAYIIIVQSHSH